MNNTEMPSPRLIGSSGLLHGQPLTIINGDCRIALRQLPAESVNCCVTSPPYWGLRDYGHADQIGQEKTMEGFIENMVAVFREVKRVLRDDGTLWLNLVKPCILAGCPADGVVLDPFGGSGTTGMVALELGRRAVLVELNPEYINLINQRCDTTRGLPLAV